MLRSKLKVGVNRLQLVACEGRSEIHRYEPACLQEGATIRPKRGVNPGEVMDCSSVFASLSPVVMMLEVRQMRSWHMYVVYACLAHVVCVHEGLTGSRVTFEIDLIGGELGRA